MSKINHKKDPEINNEKKIKVGVLLGSVILVLVLILGLSFLGLNMKYKEPKEMLLSGEELIKLMYPQDASDLEGQIEILEGKTEGVSLPSTDLFININGQDGYVVSGTLNSEKFSRTVFKDSEELLGFLEENGLSKKFEKLHGKNLFKDKIIKEDGSDGVIITNLSKNVEDPLEKIHFYIVEKDDTYAYEYVEKGLTFGISLRKVED